MGYFYRYTSKNNEDIIEDNSNNNEKPKYNLRRRNGRYISAKKKGKLTKTGNKRKCRYRFLTVYVTAKISPTLVHDVCSINPIDYTPYMSSKFKFDSDSFRIGVDNHTFRNMSNNLEHFVSKITPTKNTYLRGVGGNLKVHGVGTLTWKTNDDQGKTHELTIKNALYVPKLPSCKISPQYWAQ